MDDQNQNPGGDNPTPTEPTQAPPQEEQKCVTCGQSASGGNCVACGQGEVSCTCAAPQGGGSEPSTPAGEGGVPGAPAV